MSRSCARYTDPPDAGSGAGGRRGDEALKRETVYNVFAQTLTNWESLDRHYEEKEPFKWEYEFDYNDRLALSVQQRIRLEAQASDDEIKQYYEQNKSRYSVPAQVQLYIIDETQGPIDQVWADFAGGKSVDKVFKRTFRNSPEDATGSCQPPRPGSQDGCQ